MSGISNFFQMSVDGERFPPINYNAKAGGALRLMTV